MGFDLDSFLLLFFFSINVFIYLFHFWLRLVFIVAHGFFLVEARWGLLFIAVRGLLIAVVSLVAEHGL